MYRYRILSCLILLTPMFSIAEPSDPQPPQTDARSAYEGIASDEAKISYLIGYQLGQNLTQLDINDLNYETLWQGLLEAGAEVGSRYNEEQLAQAYARYFEWKQLQKKYLEVENLEKAQEFMSDNRAIQTISVTGSGLQYQVVTQGKGVLVEGSDWVRIRYLTKLADGTFISDSSATPEGVWVPVAELIPAWSEALQMMPLGSRWILFAGPELTFGSKPPLKSIPVNSALVFDLELIEVRSDPVTASTE